MQPSTDPKIEKRREAQRKYTRRKASEEKKLALVSNIPEGAVIKRTKKDSMSVVNKVTEYGALFNKLNDEAVAKGHAPLKTAMEVLIEAMQSDEITLKEKARIAEKLATFESSRAPIISIEHIQNLSKEEETTADEALEDFLQALKKV